MGIFDFLTGKKKLVEYEKLRQWAAQYAGRKGSSAGISAIAGEDYGKAVREFTSQIGSQGSGKPDLYLLRGLAHALKGDTGGSLKDIDKALSMNQNNPEAYLIRGIAMIQKKDKENAIKDFKKTVALDLHGRGAIGNIAQSAIEILEEKG